ncbi:MAG: hypothetical protein NT150_15805 [Bacteroidetes bacterium]|nr:hypothetical protein [Bacteroidota bacterium]
MRIKLFAILVLSYFTSFSQGGANSVYSQYGMGILYPHQFGQSFGMGNTGIAMSNPLNINLFNPASVADIKYVTFDINIVSNSFTAKDGINTPASYTDASMGTMGVAIPLLKNWGMFGGLTPYSSMGYRLKNSYTDPNLGALTDFYHGAGGINSVFLGTGYRFKNISVGAKANYLSGTLLQDRLRVISSPGYFNSYVQNKYVFSSLTFDAGLQYHINVNENLTITLGAVYGLQQSMNVKSTERALSTTQTQLLDTGAVYYNIKSVIYDNSANPMKSTLTYPQYFGGGVAMNFKEKLTLTFDYKQQEWQQFEMSSSSTTGRNYNFGAEWIPNKNSVGSENFHKRVAYRMGLRYANLPITINNTNVTDFGFNFGVALPLRKLKYERELFGSYINIGVEAGRRGSLTNGLVQETYGKINVGFTFNDKWFIKRKFD